MNPIRCPECGLINFRDDVAFPHCSQCHTDLVHCDACRHHEGTGCRHPQAYTRFTPDGQAAKKCPTFRSRYEEHRSRMMAWLPAPIWVSTLLLLILTSLAAASWFVDPIGRYFRGNPLRVETAIPQTVAVGEPFLVSLRITNLVNRASTHYYIEVSDAFLAGVDWGMPSPKPIRIDRYHNTLLLEYESLPPGGQSTIQIPFTAINDRLAPFTAKIYAPSNQLRHTIVVPINVGI